MPIFNTVPGLIPLKIFSGDNLVTSNINLINFTGSGVTASVGEFNNLIITVGGGGGGITVNTGSLLSTASFSNPNLTFTKGDGSTFSINLSTLVPTSASYAVSASFAANGGGGGETVERRHDFESPYDYCGIAPTGTLESTPNWTITRLTINPNGTTITQTAVGAWTNRTELIYS